MRGAWIDMGLVAASFKAHAGESARGLRVTPAGRRCTLYCGKPRRSD